MQQTSPFDIATPGHFGGTYLAEVVSVNDPARLSRVQVRLLSCDGIGEQDGPIWARVATPFAGPDRGAFFIPDVGDEVLVAFLQGDSRYPIVIGGLWNDAPPETLGGGGDRVDRWTIVGKAGTRIAIVEENPGEATISLTTPGNVSCQLTDAGGGKTEIRAAGATVTIDSSGVSIETPAKVKVQASQVEISAGMVTVDTAMAKFSGVVKCETMIATTTISSTYTPGAGNIW